MTTNTLDHFSIDLETLSTKYDAAILSIGAQQFDIKSGKLGGTYYAEVDITSAIKAGRVDGKTLAWWMRQDAKAKRVFAEEGKKPLSVALDELLQWMRGKSMAPRVYGNGATFDITILEVAYERGCVGLQPGWHYTNVRDMRTLVDVAQEIAGFDQRSVDRVGTHHNALDDATYQANVMIAAWASLVSLKTGKVKPLSKPAPAKPIAPIDEDEL
jgi:hypothetical protein